MGKNTPWKIKEKLPKSPWKIKEKLPKCHISTAGDAKLTMSPRARNGLALALVGQFTI